MRFPPLDIVAPVLVCCALLWWIGQSLSWAQRLAATAITLAVILVVVWLERSGLLVSQW